MVPSDIAAEPDRRRWIIPESLNVSPALLGLPLASPARRAMAILVDLVVVALLSDVGGFWLFGGLALVVLQLRSRRGGATRGPRWVIGWLGAGLVAWLALQQATDQWQAWRHRSDLGRISGGSAASAGAASDGAADTDPDVDGDSAAATAAAASAAVAMLSALPASSPAMSTAIAEIASAATTRRVGDAQRIAQLEAELAEARRPKVVGWRQQLRALFDDLGVSLGWGIVYFALLPAWWGGQTVGKKLFGLRVVELTGKPMTVMRSLKRYGGYAAGMATGGLGFAQVLWDPNRQAIQDKTAHTVVVDLRAPRRTGTADEAVPTPVEGAGADQSA